MKEDKSCWECSNNKLGGTIFLGKCEERNLKHIPPNIVDKGCPRWRSKLKKVEPKQLSLV